MSRIVEARHAFLALSEQVDSMLPDEFADAGAVLFSILQQRWEETEAEEGDTFAGWLRAYADMLEELGGSAAEPYAPSKVPGPETLS